MENNTPPPTTFSLCHSITHTHTSRGMISSEYSAAVKYHKFSYTNCITIIIIIIIIQTNNFRGKNLKVFYFEYRTCIISSVSMISSLSPSSSSSSVIQPRLFFFFLQFRNNIFYGVGLLASRPTPNLEDQVSLFVLGHHP